MEHNNGRTADQSFGLTEIHAFDLKYRLNDLRGCGVGSSVLVSIGTAPLLVSAPHSVTQIRAGAQKRAEFFTGALAEYLGAVHDAHVVASLGMRQEEASSSSPDDFLFMVETLIGQRGISHLVDLHGMSDRHQLDISVGLAGLAVASDRVQRMIDMLSQDFTVSVDHPFSGLNGLAGHVNRHSPTVAAVQIELGSRLRRDVVDRDDLDAFTNAVGLLLVDPEAS